MAEQKEKPIEQKLSAHVTAVDQSTKSEVRILCVFTWNRSDAYRKLGTGRFGETDNLVYSAGSCSPIVIDGKSHKLTPPSLYRTFDEKSDNHDGLQVKDTREKEKSK